MVVLKWKKNVEKYKCDLKPTKQIVKEIVLHWGKTMQENFKQFSAQTQTG